MVLVIASRGLTVSGIGEEHASLTPLDDLELEWIVVPDFKIGTPRGDIAADCLLLHAALGVALVERAPERPRIETAPERYADPAEAFRSFLDSEGFTSFFPGFLPIVRLIVAPDEPGIGRRAYAALASLPDLGIVDPEWVEALHSLLAEPARSELFPSAAKPAAREHDEAAPPEMRPRHDRIEHPDPIEPIQIDRADIAEPRFHGPIRQTPGTAEPEPPRHDRIEPLHIDRVDAPERRFDGPITQTPKMAGPERRTQPRRWPIVVTLAALFLAGGAWLSTSPPEPPFHRDQIEPDPAASAARQPPGEDSRVPAKQTIPVAPALPVTPAPPAQLQTSPPVSPEPSAVALPASPPPPKPDSVSTAPSTAEPAANKDATASPPAQTRRHSSPIRATRESAQRHLPLATKDGPPIDATDLPPLDAAGAPSAPSAAVP